MTQKENALCPECGRAEITKTFIHKPKNKALKMLLYQCGFCESFFPLTTIFKPADLEAALKAYVLQFNDSTTCTPGEISLEADSADAPSIEEPTFEISDSQGNHICDFHFRPYEVEDADESLERLSFREFLQERGDAWHRLVTSKCFICRHFQFKFDESAKKIRTYCESFNEYYSILMFPEEIGDDCEQFRQKRPSQLKEYLDNIKAGKVYLKKPALDVEGEDLSFILNLDTPIKRGNTLQ